MSSTTEDYLKQILAESERAGADVIGLGRLSELSGVTPGTVTTMMKSLARAGLVNYVPRTGVSLTRAGLGEANRILRRHRLIELFLVDVLGLDWSEVHSEAEVLEHAVSDRIVDRIDEMMGHPTVDPHGDPIPPLAGGFPESKAIPLADAPAGTDARVERVTNDEPGFLVFVKENGLSPGTAVRVEERDPAAGVLRVSTGSGTVALSLTAAARILVARRAPRAKTRRK